MSTQLSPDFRELRGVGASDLLYVKEDIILQHSHSFYDLIVNQVRLSPLVLHPFSSVTRVPDWRSRMISSCRARAASNIQHPRREKLLCVYCALAVRGVLESGPLFHFDVHGDARQHNVRTSCHTMSAGARQERAAVPLRCEGLGFKAAGDNQALSSSFSKLASRNVCAGARQERAAVPL